MTSQELSAALTQMTSNSSDLMVILSLEGRVLSWNRGAEKITGYQSQQVLNVDLIDLVAVEGPSYDQDRSHFAQTKNTRQTGAWRTLWKDQRGEIHDCDLVLAPIFDSKGDLSCFSLIAKDVTATERQLSVFRELELVGNIGGWEVNFKTMSVRWTEQVYRIHEVPTDEVMSVDAAINFYADWSKPIIAAAVTRAMKTAEPFDLELQIVTRKGQVRWVRSQGRMIKMNNEPYRLYGTFQDITAIKNSQAEIEKIKSAYVSNDRLLTFATLASTVAHEINNPLAVIQAKVARLKQQINSKNFDSSFFCSEMEHIENNIHRAASIVSKLNSIKFEKHIMTAEEFRLRDLIYSALELFEGKIQSRGVLVKWDDVPADFTVLAPKQFMFQIFANLLVNALEAMEGCEKKEIEITATAMGDCIQIRFKDSGAGIDKAEQERVFQDLYTSKPQRRLGLGLGVSKRLAEVMGASLSLESSRPGETVFVIELSNKNRSAVVVSAKQVRQQSHTERRVLLIEDEPELSEVLAFFLIEDGYKVTIAHSGAEARAQLNNSQFSVVLCDYRLPDGTGEELYLSLRDGRGSMPWIFLTGYADVLSQHDWPEVKAVLRKPVSHKDILSAVESALEDS